LQLGIDLLYKAYATGHTLLPLFKELCSLIYLASGNWYLATFVTSIQMIRIK